MTVREDKVTIREMMTNKLEDNGFTCDQAEAIVELAIDGEEFKSMETRWDDCSDGYELHTLATIWMGIKIVALKWMDTNAPKHWARSFFAGKERS